MDISCILFVFLSYWQNLYFLIFISINLTKSHCFQHVSKAFTAAFAHVCRVCFRLYTEKCKLCNVWFACCGTSVSRVLNSHNAQRKGVFSLKVCMYLSGSVCVPNAVELSDPDPRPEDWFSVTSKLLRASSSMD